MLKEAIDKIEFPVFNYTIYICYTTDIEASRLRRNDILGTLNQPLSKYVDGLYSYDKNDPFNSFIFINPSSSVGVISHEYFHALWRMFEEMGANLENETFAYHLSYGLDKILEFLKKAKLKTVK